MPNLQILQRRQFQQGLKQSPVSLYQQVPYPYLHIGAETKKKVEKWLTKQ